MGCSYTAHTVLGLRIPLETLKAAFDEQGTKTERGCDHDVPEGAKFCPECGAPREKVTFEEFCLGEFEWNFEAENDGLRIVYTTNEYTKYIFAGIVASCHEDYMIGTSFPAVSPQDAEDLKDKLRKIFIPYHVWDTREFGLWTVLYTGC